MSWSGDAPIYQQIKRLCLNAVMSGEIAPGAALPSVRQYAADNQVNPLTVARAYQDLENLGVVEKRRGLGFFVCSDAPLKLQSEARQQFITVEWPATVHRAHQLGVNLTDLLQKDFP